MNLARFYTERICPVCGHKLDFTPWDGSEFKERSCPCCGIHFGYDDLIEIDREAVYRAWRNRWVAHGMRWWGKNPAPECNPEKQLATLERLMKEWD
jgi:hypothetical protein